MQRRVHVWVSGKVQGVYYRATTAKKAQSLGLSGWVKNLEDGRVEFVAQGDSECVQALIDWSHRGPVMAKVEEVVVEPEPVAFDLQTFSVEYEG